MGELNGVVSGTEGGEEKGLKRMCAEGLDRNTEVREFGGESLPGRKLCHKNQIKRKIHEIKDRRWIS